MTTAEQTTALLDTLSSSRPSSSLPCHLYVRKLFTAGLLKGMSIVAAIPFPDVYTAAAFAGKHRSEPVKSFGGAKYIIADASFQNFAR